MYACACVHACVSVCVGAHTCVHVHVCVSVCISLPRVGFSNYVKIIVVLEGCILADVESLENRLLYYHLSPGAL